MNYDLADCIKDSFEDTMKDYMESEDYNEETMEFNKLYYQLRNRLLPEEQKMLDAIFYTMQNSDSAIAREAYYRGIIIGMAHNKKVLGGLGLGC